MFIGKEIMQEIDIKKLRAGTVISAKTSSGNNYLFEVTNPEECKAKVTRLEVRPRASRTGDLGERVVTQVMRVGEPIFHNNSNTSEVTELELK
jgi:hypothetical protein